MKKCLLLVALLYFIPTGAAHAQTMTSKIKHTTIERGATEEQVIQVLGKPDKVQHDCDNLVRQGKQMRWIYNYFPSSITSVLIDNTEGNLDDIINTIDKNDHISVFTYASDPKWIELYVFANGRLEESLIINRSELETEFEDKFGDDVMGQVEDFVARFESIQ